MKHVANQESIKNNIIAIEKQFSVDKWKIGGIDVWPYIRIILYMSFLTQSNQSLGHNDSIKKTKGKALLLRKIGLPFLFIKAFFSQLIFFSKLKKKKILFFGSHIHRVKQNGEYFNRFYDSIVDYYKLYNNVYMIEYQKVYENSFNKKAVINLSKELNNYKLLRKLERYKKPLNHSVSLEGYDTFLDTLKSFDLDIGSMRITKEYLVKWTAKIVSIQPFFKRFYEKTNSEKIVFLGYYGLDDLYAALITANQMNIKTVDFQHGPQTNVHMAYSHWTKLPKDGFNTMPIEFWNWDKESKENIHSWSKNTTNVKPLVFGQPYLHYWLKHNKNSKEEEKIILYSMQTSPLDLFTDKLVSLIKQSEYKWVLRLHPRNKTAIQKLNHFLKKNEISNNTIIQDAYSVPLPKVLSNSILHITNYSGCVIEAQMMGVTTVLVHQIGLEMFMDYIDDSQVYYLSQKNENFLQSFESIVSKMPNHKNQTNLVKLGNPLD
ncbi:hypothetical protein Q4Q34_01105 [Flavivirga abyssicola]|uniref:hypothetical protein n=1 Tax=Flavivirga abyssicola TaxID=3063533 RepID=UPI0026DF5BC3|nr:hypothetical protein [Flavivirga sp. MEBiC07777]WVK13636.1 hypothetical protein Q4Q34_01105 [Flavivirga sp. MEBiC07777]